MTEEQAKEYLKSNYVCCCPFGTSPTKCDDEKCEFGQAIRALIEERPQGNWAKIGEIGIAYTCNKCNELNIRPTNFCPYCGADMRNPNCVRCDHFGKCEGCEKGEEE